MILWVFRRNWALLHDMVDRHICKFWLWQNFVASCLLPPPPHYFCPTIHQVGVASVIDSINNLLYHFDQVFRHVTRYTYNSFGKVFRARKIGLKRKLRDYFGHFGWFFRDFRPKNNHFRSCYMLQNTKVFSSVTPVPRYMNTSSKSYSSPKSRIWPPWW